MTGAASKSLGRDGAEVLDVVGHQRPLLRCRDVHHLLVGAGDEARSLLGRPRIQVSLAQEAGDLSRELLVEQAPQGRSARCPACQAA